MGIIESHNIIKEFKIPIKSKGKINAFHKLFSKDYEMLRAVDNISFNVDKGEIVGFLGPNGAGKSTTIKMLTGIIQPDGGKILVQNVDPFVNRVENAKKIGVVFGHRSQLLWDLSIEDTFILHKKMYKLEDYLYKKNIELFTEILELDSFSGQQVRQLSLGQKMRANLAVALLHDPEILYLDEPTIGLDVLAKENIRKFIAEINREKKITVILTTHDMSDVEEVCSRIVMIDKGRVLYDGTIDEFKRQFSQESYITIDFISKNITIDGRKMTLYKEEGTTKTYKIDKGTTVAEAIMSITRMYDVRDIKIHEPGVEEIVKHIYKSR